MSKSLEELKDLFSNFDGNLQAEFIEQFPEIWDDAYDIMMGSRYHRVMTSCMLAGWFAAIKAVSEREKKLVEALDDGTCNSIKETLALMAEGEGTDFRVYMRMAMSAHKKLNEALKEFRGGK